MEMKQNILDILAVRLRSVLFKLDYDRLMEIRLRSGGPLMILYDNCELFLGMWMEEMIGKIIGGICIAVGSVGIGNSMIKERKRQIKGLMELERILEYMKASLRYGRSPVPELFLQIEEKFHSPEGQLFKNMKEELGKTKEPLHSIWEKEMGEYSVQNHLSKDVSEELLVLGKSMGQVDLEHQTEMIELYLLQSRQVCQTYQSQRKQQEKVTLTVCTCMGMLLLLLLV